MLTVLRVGSGLVAELGSVRHESLHVFDDEDAAIEGVLLLREERQIGIEFGLVVTAEDLLRDSDEGLS